PGINRDTLNITLLFLDYLLASNDQIPTFISDNLIKNML
ncbi:MAG: hypothetical protein ACI825_000421, partial [Planctomycetota bacterium]